MRQVRFALGDRLVLTPVELVANTKKAIAVLGVFFLLNAIGFSRYGWVDLIAVLGAVVTGCVMVPRCYRSFRDECSRSKALFWGFFGRLRSFCCLAGLPQMHPAGSRQRLSAFDPRSHRVRSDELYRKFTYTSPSGVNREMRLTLLPQVIGVVLGMLALLAADVIGCILEV